jgi:CBS domain-containing protein
MLVRDLMAPSMGGVSPDSPLRDAWERLRALDIDPLPVVDGDHVVGMVSRDSLQRALETHGITSGTLPVHDIMNRDIQCPSPDDDAGDALSRLQSPGEGARVPVVGSDGRLAGMVTAQALRQGAPDSGDGVTAVDDMNAIDSLVSYDEDRVEYDIDASFPASDPAQESSAGTTGPSRGGDTT